MRKDVSIDGSLLKEDEPGKNKNFLKISKLKLIFCILK